jgi:hypothetical protein
MPDSRKRVIAEFIDATLQQGGYETLGVTTVYSPMAHEEGYGTTIIFRSEGLSIAINVVEGPDLFELGVTDQEGKEK